MNWRIGEEKCSVEGCESRRYNRLYMCYAHYYRDYRYNNPLEPSHNLGNPAEVAIATVLKSHGREVKTFPSNHPFDLLVDGFRIEVKSAQKSLGYNFAPFWKFAIPQYKTGEPSDYYVLSPTSAPKPYTYLLLKSPIGKATFTISERQLKRHIYDQAAKDFEALCLGEPIVK